MISDCTLRADHERRLVKLQNLQSKAPFAIPTPTLLDLLPSAKDAIHPIVTGLSFSNDVQPNLFKVRDENGEMTFNLFSSIAKATYLLSRAIDDISASREVQQADWQSKFARLDQTIQSFAMTLGRTTDVLIRCWPYDICMR